MEKIFTQGSLPEANQQVKTPENRQRLPKGKEKVFQKSIFSCELLVSRRVVHNDILIVIFC